MREPRKDSRRKALGKRLCELIRTFLVYLGLFLLILVTLPLLLIEEIIDRRETARIKRELLKRSTWVKDKKRRM